MTTTTGLGWPTGPVAPTPSKGLGWPGEQAAPRIEVDGESLRAVDAAGETIANADVALLQESAVVGERAVETPSAGPMTVDPSSGTTPVLSTDEESVENATENTELAAPASPVGDAQAGDVGGAPTAPILDTDEGSVGNAVENAELADATGEDSTESPMAGRPFVVVPEPEPEPEDARVLEPGGAESPEADAPREADRSEDLSTEGEARRAGRRSRTSALDSAWEERADSEAADKALFGDDVEAGRSILAEAAAAVTPAGDAGVSRETLLTERPVGSVPTIDLPVAERSGEGAGSLVDAHLTQRTRAVAAAEAARVAAERAAEKQAKDAVEALPAPAHTRVLTVANQKGGVGKTTTTVNVAAALAKAGLRVLVVDLDPQGNASTALGVPHSAEVKSVYDVLVDGMPLHEVVQECPDIEGLWCAPATIDLAGAEIELVSLVAREMRLGRALTAFLREQETKGERLDYVLIDCPPSLGLLTINAFVAADEVFIPIQCEYYALEGLSQLLKNIELIKAHLNPVLHVSTILLTMFDGRTRLSSQVADEVRRHFGPQVIKSMVPRSVRISEAPSHGQTVITYDPTSSGALSYTAAAVEIAEAGASQEGITR